MEFAAWYRSVDPIIRTYRGAMVDGTVVGNRRLCSDYAGASGYPASKDLRSDEATSFPLLRKAMVERDIAPRGVRDELVIDAMQKVNAEFSGEQREQAKIPHNALVFVGDGRPATSRAPTGRDA